MRRTSNRLAARDARPDSSSAFSLWPISSSPVGPPAVVVLSAIVGVSLGEDDGQDGGQAQRAGGQRRGLAVPDALRGVRPLLLVRHAVDEALQVADRLGLG